MSYAGEEYSFEDFKVNDKEALPQTETKSVLDELRLPECGGASSSGYNQLPPKFMGDRPSFKKNREK